MIHIDLGDLEFLQEANQILEASVTDSKHPFHQFTFATSHQHHIEQRTVVLRKWSLKRRTLIFHSDIRSPKIRQIKLNPKTSILFYSKPDKLQLRFRCFSHIHYQNRLSNYFFKKTTSSQKRCYKINYSPSSEIDPTKSIEYNQTPDENFSVCVSNFDELDLLYLNHKSHIRIKYFWNRQGKLTSVRLSP